MHTLQQPAKKIWHGFRIS